MLQFDSSVTLETKHESFLGNGTQQIVKGSEFNKAHLGNHHLRVMDSSMLSVNSVRAREIEE